MSATYTASTLRRARTILRNQENADRIARAAATRAPRTPKAAPRKLDWKVAPASETQIARIQRKERTLGLPITPDHGAGMTGMEAREWNTALNGMLSARKA